MNRKSEQGYAITASCVLWINVDSNPDDETGVSANDSHISTACRSQGERADCFQSRAIPKTNTRVTKWFSESVGIITSTSRRSDLHSRRGTARIATWPTSSSSSQLYLTPILHCCAGPAAAIEKTVINIIGMTVSIRSSDSFPCPGRMMTVPPVEERAGLISRFGPDQSARDGRAAEEANSDHARDIVQTIEQACMIATLLRHVNG
jgi:hypothetical protein